MRRILAFFTALVLFAGIVLSIHLYTWDRLDADNEQFGGWTDPVKYKSRDAIAANMDEDTLLVMGSSELEHGKGTPFHPSSILAGQKTKLMLIGEGYYQCLFHATALAALEPNMENKKLVLLLSPQWFRKAGVLPEAYASRFSELNYLAMLQNPDISPEVKSYITKRTEELLGGVDDATLGRVERYKRLYLEKDGSWMDELYASTYGGFLREKDRVSVVSKMKAAGIREEGVPQKSGAEHEGAGVGVAEVQKNGDEREDADMTEARKGGAEREGADAAEARKSGTEREGADAAEARKSGTEHEGAGTAGRPDFERLRAEAEETGKQYITNNPFYVTDQYFTKNLEPVMEEEKDKGIKTGYSESPEYEDLECFLQVCRDTGIQPLLVIMPVNGYWYDYIGFDKEAREDYYSKIRGLAQEYGAGTADFSDREYEPYFMEDTIHLGWKGWVDVSEAIYEFGTEAQSKF